MRKIIQKSILQERSGLRNYGLEAQLSATLDKILRLSSWTPSSTHNEHLRELLRNALVMINDLGGNAEYLDHLRDFMKQHTAFCAFTLDNAYVITSEDSEAAAELCKNLRRLAQNLREIASTKAVKYQKLYENLIAHKEDLSYMLDSAYRGQGKLHPWFFILAFQYSFFL
jgi:nitrogen fixation/metabolism regulation signal transduction histidine kinase